MKRAFTFLMSLFLVAGTMWAQTEATRMTAEQLNAVTERKAIAIECTQITNYNRYYDHVNGDSYGLTSGMNSNLVYYWVPVEEGVAGTYHIMRGEGEEDYLQNNNITTYGKVENAAVFHAMKPYIDGDGVENFSGADCYYNKTDAEKATWVRLAFLDNSKWFNFNGKQYNSGTGVWTVFFVHDMSATVEPEVEYADAELISAFMAKVIGLGELKYDLDATWASLPAVLASLETVTPLIGKVEKETPVLKTDVEAAIAVISEASAVAVYYNETYLPTAKKAADLRAALEEGSEGYVAVGEAISSTSDLSAVTTVAELEEKVAVLEKAIEDHTPEGGVVKTDYTDAIKNAAVSEKAEWASEGFSWSAEKLYRGSAESFDFTQTIVLPAGQYKMTVKAAYRYASSNDKNPTEEEHEYNQIQAGAETHLAKVYAQTATYKYEGNVQNRWEGASDENFAPTYNVSTVNGKFVPNATEAVVAWFDNGMYINELVFNVQEDGEVKIGIAKNAKAPNGDYTNIGAWTLTRLGDAEADPKEEEPTPNPEAGDVTSKYLKNAGFDDASSWVEEGKVDQAAKPVADWTVTTTNPQWFYSAALGYGSAATVNDKAAPATNPEGVAEGGALGISVGWGCVVEYTQNVVLPAGVYTLTYKAINLNDAANQAANYFGFKSGSTTYYGKTTNFTYNVWEEYSTIFVLREETEGAISVGIGAISGGSGANAKLFIDGVTLSYDPEIPSGDLVVGDVTDQFLVNADFETASPKNENAINTPPGWTLKHETSGWLDGSTRQSTNPGGDGSQCYNLWAGTVNLADIYQKVTLPAGKYKLTVGLYSDGDAERYAYATVGGNTIKSANAKFGSWDFVSVEFLNASAGEVTLGAVSKGWFQIDNVTLEYLGEVLKDDFVNAYNQVLGEAKALVGQKMGLSVATQLDAVILANGSLTAESSIEDLDKATNAISAVVVQAKASAATYAANKTAIDGMFALMNSTNVYTVEAYEAYKAKAEGFLTQYEAGALNDKVDNPMSIHGWRATPDYCEVLLSAFGIAVDDWANLHINTWSTEGETDGSDFKVPFYEYWTGDDQSLGVTTKTATVAGLTPGKSYEVEAWVRVRAKNGVAATDATGITLSVGEGEATDITEGEVIGASQFSHAVFTATGKADETGALKINFNILEGNNVSWLSFKNVKYTEVEVVEPEYLTVVGAKVGDVAIVEGKATVESISSFDITFDRPVALAEDAEWAVLTDSWGDNSLKAEVLEDNNSVVRFSLQWGQEFTEAGDFYLYIPEGVVVDAENVNCINAAIEAVITIEAAPATPLTVTNVTVGEDVMEGFTVVATTEDMIKVNFDGMFYYQGDPTIVDAEGKDALEFFEFGVEESGTSYFFAGKKAGVYTITLAKASFLEYMSYKAPAEDIVLKVTISVPDGIQNINADADAVIYDIHGRRVEKMTKGLYIVNGRKVMVK